MQAKPKDFQGTLGRFSHMAVGSLEVILLLPKSFLLLLLLR